MLTLLVFGQHAKPGESYGLRGGGCGNENLVPYDWSSAIADSAGDFTIVAPDLSLDGYDPNLWIEVHPMGGGATLGGITGPFIGGGSRTFRSTPPC